MSVASEQRFTRSRPCPICGGHEGEPRGKDKRCYGFMSSDFSYAHCTREEFAEGLDQNQNSNTYPHRLEGECNCGTRHGEPAPPVYASRNGRRREPWVEPSAEWRIKDVEGEVQAIHVRFEKPDGDKDFKWKRANGEWGLDGRPVADLPLYLSEHASAWPEDMPVVVVEGEKAADALQAVHPAVVGTITGAAGTPGAEALEVLSGRSVILWPDNDDTGRQHMERIAKQLQGVSMETRIFEPADAAPEDDAADHPAVTSGAQEGIEELKEAWDAAPVWEAGEVSLSSSPIEKERQGHQAGDSLRAVRFAEMGEPKERRYLIDGLIPEPYPTVVFGDGGVAKSMLMLSAGMSVAAGGEEWLGMQVAGGPVLYTDFELDGDEQNRRAHRLAKGMGLEKPPDDLFYLSALGHSTSEALGAAHEDCQKYGVKLMILDSLGPALEGDAMAARDVIGFYRRRLEPFRAAGVTVVIVDHQAKLQAGEQYASKRAFGSVYKGNLARSVVQIEGGERGEGTLTVSLRQVKRSFGPPTEPFGARLTFGEGSVTVDAVELDAADLAKEQTLNAPKKVELALEEGPATPADIAERTGLALNTVKNALTRLRKAGKVKATGKKKGQAEEVSLVSSGYRDEDGDTEQGAHRDRGGVTCIHDYADGKGCYICDPEHPFRSKDR